MPHTAPLPSPNVPSLEPISRALDNEWTWLSGARPNILLVGDRTATRAAVSDLQSTHQLPIATWTCGSRPLMLPASESARTIILHDVAQLSLGEQQMLSDWLSRENGGTTQFVTTTSVPLFPLVMSGAFLATLYYRLNVIYAEVTAGNR